MYPVPGRVRGRGHMKYEKNTPKTILLYLMDLSMQTKLRPILGIINDSSLLKMTLIHYVDVALTVAKFYECGLRLQKVLSTVDKYYSRFFNVHDHLYGMV